MNSDVVNPGHEPSTTPQNRGAAAASSADEDAGLLLAFAAGDARAFAVLVEYTKETHKELSNMSAGLARYTQATYEELHSMNQGLEAYTNAMGKTMNSIVAKHCCAEEERARAAARPQSGDNNK